MRLHNEYFSPLWGRQSAVGESIEMSFWPFV
jgi:hypothetical protein